MSGKSDISFTNSSILGLYVLVRLSKNSEGDILSPIRIFSSVSIFIFEPLVSKFEI